MLSDIRNYRRPSSAGGYNVPEAPPIGDLGRYAPGGEGSVMRSSAHPGRGGNMFDEIRQRNGGGYMGLRPTQTRTSSAYPRDANNDFLARAMANRRSAIEEPIRPQGRISSGRY